MNVKVENGVVVQYPYSPTMLRKDNPSTSFPKRMSGAALQSWGVYPVEVASRPSYTERTQKLVQAALPTLINGDWTLGWTIVDKTTEEISKEDSQIAELNRETRNTLLSETDWWASADLTMTAEQTAYRQALRDITSHANWPHLDEADWPTKP